MNNYKKLNKMLSVILLIFCINCFAGNSNKRANITVKNISSHDIILRPANYESFKRYTRFVNRDDEWYSYGNSKHKSYNYMNKKFSIRGKLDGHDMENYIYNINDLWNDNPNNILMAI